MDQNLKEAVQHHRNLVDMHAHKPRETPRESIAIVLMADIHAALCGKPVSKKKAAKKPK